MAVFVYTTGGHTFRVASAEGLSLEEVEDAVALGHEVPVERIGADGFTSVGRVGFTVRQVVAVGEYS